ncbi:MAG: outer membrane lipoprotein carrier protein LolA [Elusimicrobiales bacterium]|nr:outer membrane lipoprotein carrier protein LolA [Elusimicrobiales bacterium]
MKILKLISICLLLTGTLQITLQAKSPVKTDLTEQIIQDPPLAKSLPNEDDKKPKELSPDFIVEKLKEWDNKLASLETDFFQEINFKEAGLKKTIKGEMRYLKPNYLKISHLAPEKQTIVTDKKILWIHKPADNQVIKTPWNNWFKQNNQLSGILDFGNYSKLVKNNTVKIHKDKSSEIIIDFISKKNPSLYKLTLKLSSTDFFPMGAVLDLEQTIISTELRNTKKNTRISTDTFQFTPPKNAEVIEFGDFK